MATHGHARGYKTSPTYRTWTGMKVRCNDLLNEDYGAKGITYDPRWEKFDNFLADMGERPDGMTLDRIDGDGNYCKENCRWADKLTQDNNRSSCRWLELNGERHSLTAWSRKLGISRDTLKARIRYGWSDERVLTEPVQTHRKAA